MSNPLFSIIIPVYNSEKYLPRCIDSIINQDFEDFEILLVDDSSIDGSYQICCEYANSDSRIRVLHNGKNEGVTITRNRGIRESCGLFLLFVDNDDYIEDNYLSVFADAYRKTPNADLFVQNIIFQKEKVGNQIIKGFDSLGGPWGKMFKRSIVVDNNIQFIPKLRYNEDNLFMLDYLQFVEKKVELNVALYHYTENEDCTSKKLETNFEATGEGLIILLQRIENDSFRYQFQVDFAKNRACFMFHRYVKSLYGHKVHSRKQRRSSLIKVCTASRKAIHFYPTQFKSDRIICLMLSAKCYFLADFLAEFFWRLRAKTNN